MIKNSKDNMIHDVTASLRRTAEGVLTVSRNAWRNRLYADALDKSPRLTARHYESAGSARLLS